MCPIAFHPKTLNKQSDVCLTMQKCTGFTDKRIAAYPHFKHSDDCKQPTTMLPVINHHNNNNHTDYFARQAKKMPSSDPANATIFLIPALVRLISHFESFVPLAPQHREPPCTPTCS